MRPVDSSLGLRTRSFGGGSRGLGSAGTINVARAGQPSINGSPTQAADTTAARGPSRARLPQVSANTNAAAEAGAIPAKVFDRLLASVAAGLAKLVEDVNRMAAPMYAPTAYGTAAERWERMRPKTTRTRPRVAMTSEAHKPLVVRTCCDTSTAGSPKMTFARTAPTVAPASWAATYVSASRGASPPDTQATSVIAGLIWPPETGPIAKMIATRPRPVASAFSRSWKPWSPGLRRVAAMPEPTMPRVSKAVPTSSAPARRRRAASCTDQTEEGTSWASRACTRTPISSRIPRTSSTLLPAGSVSSQSR